MTPAYRKRSCHQYQVALSTTRNWLQPSIKPTLNTSRLANAYGSVHHDLIRFSLNHYHADKWLNWSLMKAKVSKCQALAIAASTGSVYDPDLSVAGGKIPFAGSRPVRFLGGTIQVPRNYASARDDIKGKLETLLERVDAVSVTRKQKLKLYRLGVCPRLSWDLTITEFSVSWLEKTLDSMVTRYLKKWAGLARPADPARLYLPQANGGFNLPLPSTLYQKLQVGKASLLITSRDAGVSHAVREALKKEQHRQHSKFQPNMIAQQQTLEQHGRQSREWQRAWSRTTLRVSA